MATSSESTDLWESNNGLFNKILVGFETKIQESFMSQQRLDEQINGLLETLENIKIDEGMTEDIAKTAKRVVELKRRITLINSIINNSTCRCRSILESNKQGNYNLNSKQHAKSTQASKLKHKVVVKEQEASPSNQ